MCFPLKATEKKTTDIYDSKSQLCPQVLICSCARGLSLALNSLVENTQISTDSDCTFFHTDIALNYYGRARASAIVDQCTSIVFREIVVI